MNRLILPKDIDSKFRFITVAAQRAKQLQGGAKPRVETRSRKPTRIAVEEAARGHDLVGDPRRAAGTGGRGRSGGVAGMGVVVLGVTGCIGAYKACELLRELQRHELDVHVVMTAAATRFVTPLTFEALSRHPVFHDQFALGAERRDPPRQPGRRRGAAARRPGHRQHRGQARARHRGRRAQHARPRDEGAARGGAGHEREHVRAPGRPGEPGRAAGARRHGRGAGQRLPRVRMAGQGPARRDRRDRGCGAGRAATPARSRGRDRAGDRRADGRGPRPRALRVEPVQRAHGLSHRRGRARSRRLGRPGVGSDEPPGAGRHRDRAGAIGRGDAARGPRAAAARHRGRRRRGRQRLSARDGRRLEAQEGAREAHARAGPDSRRPEGRRGREGRAHRRRLRGGDRGPAGERTCEARSQEPRPGRGERRHGRGQRVRRGDERRRPAAPRRHAPGRAAHAASASWPSGSSTRCGRCARAPARPRRRT